MTVESTTWTSEQNAVIRAEPGARILVDAGPGTGKTATACARVAWLMKSARLEPSEIWLVSFTRTAVREIRNRIAGYCGGVDKVAGMRIATIDAHAWAINSGFNEAVSLSGMFDDNIANVIALLQQHAGVFEYLNSVKHFVVDEAQDVVGIRCELLLEMINALPPSCGVSVFSDEAQAIYGFAEDADETGVDGHLPEKIREYMPDFQCLNLSTVHRTSDPKLRKVFADGRSLLRSKRGKGAKQLAGVKELVESTNHGVVGVYHSDVPSVPENASDAFLLFRRRGEALSATGYLGVRAHRVRMSGLPICVDGRIASIFWDWTEPFMDEPTFAGRYRERVAGTDATALWRTLVHLFGPSASRLSVTKMVSRLSSGSPPLELVLPDFGSGSGPMVGTIHGAKGREASEVRLYVPPEPWGDPDDETLEEEARIIFVGATRAKHTLKIGKGASRVVPRRLEPSGRAYSPYHYGTARANVEVGAARDLDAAGLVGRACFAASRDAQAAQQLVMTSCSTLVELKASSAGATMDWRYRISLAEDPEDRAICFLATGVNGDLFAIARVVDELVRQNRKKPPLEFQYFRSYGVRTLVLSQDDPIRETLHSPWRDSGVVAAPMVLGYPMCYFRY
jgi:hypothetical protein